MFDKLKELLGERLTVYQDEARAEVLLEDNSGLNIRMDGGAYHCDLHAPWFEENRGVFAFYRTRHEREVLGLLTGMENASLVKKGGLQLLMHTRPAPLFGFVTSGDAVPFLVFNPFYELRQQAIVPARRDLGLELRDPELEHGTDYVQWCVDLETAATRGRATVARPVTTARRGARVSA